MDIKTFLKSLPAFEDFNAQQLDMLANRMTVTEHEDGHVFIRQGQEGKALYLVMQGTVRITRHDGADGAGDEENEVGELCDGELFGILSLVEDLPASATCTAKGHVTVAALTRDAFLQLFHDASPVGRHLQYMVAVQMARDLQETNRRLRATLNGA